jgi:hypothetical protein
MKKQFYTFTLFTAVIAGLWSCKKESSEIQATEEDIEQKQQLHDLSTIESNAGFKSILSSNICCYTPPANITRDPGFLGIVPANLYGGAPCNNLKKNTMVGYNTDWFATPYSNTPQVGVSSCATLALAMGACNRGYVHFWGNKQFGGAITQDNQAFSPFVNYTVQFNARIRPGNIGATRLGLRLSTTIPTTNPRTGAAPYSPNIYTSTVVTDTIWRCYKFTFKDSTNYYKVLNIFPTNQFSGAGNYSRLDIDDVKIW